MGCTDTISFYPLSQEFFYFHVYENFVVEGRMDPCICMAKSLHCSPEIIASLLVGYTPIQNKKFFFFLRITWAVHLKCRCRGPSPCPQVSI